MRELNVAEIEAVSGGLKASEGMAAVGSALLLGAVYTSEFPPVAAELALGGAIITLGGSVAALFGY